MTWAAILALEDFRDTHRRAEMRQRLHARCAHWLNLLEDRMQDQPPTLAELAPAVWALRQEWTQGVTARLVAPAHRTLLEQRTAACPQCGQALAARGPQARPVQTRVGAVRLRRPSFSCAPCQRGTAPLDEALPRTERRQPPDGQQAAVQLTQELPSESACELCEALTGLPLRAHPAHEVAQGVAEGLAVLDVAPSRQDIAARVAAVATGQTWRPMMGLAMDGADVPTRPETAPGRRPGRKNARAKRARGAGAWREAKGCRCYRLADDRIVQVLSWHRVQTAAEGAEALRQVKAAGLIPQDQGRRCVMAEGAPWLWKQGPVWCPSAVEMLGYDHCGEPLDTVAPRPYGGHPERPQEWSEAAVARLFWGEVHGVIWGLQRMKPTAAQAAEEITQLMGDLQRHQERLDSRFARQGGDPMGSGGIESAHTCIGHVRLKRAGAWWDGDACQPEAGPTGRDLSWDLRPGLCSLPTKAPRAVRAETS